MLSARRPRALLCDYGGTLVEEVSYDPHAGMELMLRHAVLPPNGVDRGAIRERAERITHEVADRRDVLHVETPWPALSRLIYDHFGIEFDRPIEELELPFWDASTTTRAMPGVRDALAELSREGVRLGVVGNASFRAKVIRSELAKHGLDDFMRVIVVSAEYAVRKPNPLLFETAAARLGVACEDAWFIGDRLDTDVAGAREAGMLPVWYTWPRAKPAGHAGIAVSTWAELMSLFHTSIGTPTT